MVGKNSSSKKIKSNKLIEERIKRLISNQPFCYKDPRFSYTLPIWQDFFDLKTKYIVVFREPNKTIDSIIRECKENPSLKSLKMTKHIALKVWTSMYSHILMNYEQSEMKDKWLFFHFDQIFEKDKVSNLESFVNLSLDVNFAEKRLSRSIDNNKETNRKALEIYNHLISLS